MFGGAEVRASVLRRRRARKRLRSQNQRQEPQLRAAVSRETIRTFLLMKSNLESHCIHLGHWRHKETEKNRMLHNEAQRIRPAFSSTDFGTRITSRKFEDFDRKCQTGIISSTSVKMRQFISTITERSAATDEKLLTLLAGVPVGSYERRGL